MKSPNGLGGGKIFWILLKLLGAEPWDYDKGEKVAFIDGAINGTFIGFAIAELVLYIFGQL